MPRIILLVAIIAIGYIVYTRISALPPQQRRGAYLKTGLGLLVAVVVLLTVTGRMHWIGAAATGLLVAASRLLPLVFKLFPVFQALQGNKARAADGGQQSTVETALLRMVLDHDSGTMNGEVLSGEFSGRSLDEMNEDELNTLLQQALAQDTDSARLLETYLQRRFGDQEQYRQSPPPNSATSSAMNRAEALAILGLQESASEKDIISAHRSLMQKLHPDRGGNDYLAAKLNQAKDFLLG